VKKGMNHSRIDMLEIFIAEDPSDPFNYYALALEYLQTNPDKAGELFDKIMFNHPDYLPVYYTAGTFYADRSNDVKALEILNKGVELAKRTSDFKTLSELQSAIQNLD
jgi:tetratricopeptide (TPR) repeat protein